MELTQATRSNYNLTYQEATNTYTLYEYVYLKKYDEMAAYTRIELAVGIPEEVIAQMIYRLRQSLTVSALDNKDKAYGES